MKRNLIIKSKKGFTLVEVIVSIAIIGMIVVPISTIFMRTLNQIIDAREILKATQLAQLCVENMKAKSEKELMELFENDPDEEDLLGERIILPEESDLLGIDQIPKGYAVKLGYDKTNPIFQDEAYQNQNSLEEIDFDASLSFESGMGKDFWVESGEQKKRYRPNLSVSNRIIYIQYKDEDSIVSIKDGALTELYPFIVEDGTPVSISKNHFAIKVNCLDRDIHNPDFQTKIYVQNESNTPIHLYIYQGNTNTVNLKVNDEDGFYTGKTKTHYNMQDASQATHKVYEIWVEVYDKRGDLLTKVEATKVDE